MPQFMYDLPRWAARDAQMRKLGVVIPSIVQKDYSGELYRGITDAALQHRCTLVTSIQNARRQDDLSILWGKGGCDGIVLAAPYNYEHIIQQCHAHQCECVLIEYAGDPYERIYPTVSVTNCAGVRAAVQHVVELGHRRIGFITGRLQDSSAQQRLFGYRAALENAGIAFDPTLVAEGSWRVAENYRAAQALFRLDLKPTAVVSSCDLGAFAVYQLAREHGMEVGRDISVVGFDDMPAAANGTPPLTTVRQPVYRVGQVAVETLLMRLDGEPLPQMNTQLATELIVRESTGRAL